MATFMSAKSRGCTLLSADMERAESESVFENLPAVVSVIRTRMSFVEVCPGAKMGIEPVAERPAAIGDLIATLSDSCEEAVRSLFTTMPNSEKTPPT